MTEPKEYWMRIDMDGVHLHEENIYNDGTCKLCSDKELSMAKFTGTIDGQPLSTEQLHELIVSQSMTIDRLLTEIGRLNDDANEYGRLINGYRKILDDYKAIVDFYQKDKP